MPVLKGATTAFKNKKSCYRICIDNDKLFINAASIIIANAGNMYKDIFTVTPFGTVDDGKLDVFIRRTNSLFDTIDVFFRIIFNRQEHTSKIIYRQASKISIKSKNNKFHIDGEQKTFRNDLNIQVIPKSINVIVP